MYEYEYVVYIDNCDFCVTIHYSILDDCSAVEIEGITLSPTAAKLLNCKEILDTDKVLALESDLDLKRLYEDILASHDRGEPDL